MNLIGEAASGLDSDSGVMQLADETLSKGREQIDHEIETTSLTKIALEGLKDLGFGLVSNASIGEVRHDLGD